MRDFVPEEAYRLIVVPKEVDKLFTKEYERLKKQANTYKELENIVSSEIRYANWRDKIWAPLVERELKKRLREEMGNLSIREETESHEIRSKNQGSRKPAETD